MCFNIWSFLCFSMSNGRHQYYDVLWRRSSVNCCTRTPFHNAGYFDAFLFFLFFGFYFAYQQIWKKDNNNRRNSWSSYISVLHNFRLFYLFLQFIPISDSYCNIIASLLACLWINFCSCNVDVGLLSFVTSYYWHCCYDQLEWLFFGNDFLPNFNLAHSWK